jgi:hypothetical protein
MFALMAAASAILFYLTSHLNDLLFYNADFEFTTGVGWIYLPAGMRLLCTLLFGAAGAVGVLFTALYVSTFTYFSDDLPRAIAGSIATALAPYLTYVIAQKIYGLKPSLSNLNAKRLFFIALLHAIASPSLLHLALLLIGREMGVSFFVMVIGDFAGTLILIYAFKLILSFIPPKKPVRNDPT